MYPQRVVLLLAASFALVNTVPPSVMAQDANGSVEDWLRTEVGPVSLLYTSLDSQVAGQFADYAEDGRRQVEQFFGTTYSSPFAFRIFPGRATLDSWWAAEWGIPDLETQCWMVGSGEAENLAILSPRVWAEEACEHDASDEERIQQLVTHEMVHVFHLQSTPAEAVEMLEPIGWFVEGLAVYASGQLVSSHAASARESIETGAAPEQLEDGWSGRYRYGVSGSLVQFIDETYGRDMTIRLVQATSEDEILDAIGMSEAGLLEAWRRFVREQPGN